MRRKMRLLKKNSSIVKDMQQKLTALFTQNPLQDSINVETACQSEMTTFYQSFAYLNVLHSIAKSFTKSDKVLKPTYDIPLLTKNFPKLYNQLVQTHRMQRNPKQIRLVGPVSYIASVFFFSSLKIRLGKCMRC